MTYRHASAMACVLTMAGLVGGCGLPFYLQAAGGQIELWRQRTPIAAVLDDPAVAPQTKASLREVEAILAFASEALGLPDNGSYRSFVDLERPFVVWNVVAAPEFSTVPEQSCFPVTGCVSYRGYFAEDRAQRHADALRAQGLDVYVGGATAYSTLGYFADPVLSTMLGRSPGALAALLIHELAHQRLYVKGDSELSESFASVVEQFGTRAWLMSRGDAAELAAYDARLAEQAVFAELVTRQQARLAVVFARDIPAAEMRQQKAAAYREFLADYESRRAAGAIGEGYAGWFSRGPNNAALAAVATYQGWVPTLQAQIDRHGLDTFYQQMTGLAAMTPEARAAELALWAAAADRDFAARAAVSNAARLRAAGQ